MPSVRESLKCSYCVYVFFQLRMQLKGKSNKKNMALSGRYVSHDRKIMYMCRSLSYTNRMTSTMREFYNKKSVMYEKLYSAPQTRTRTQMHQHSHAIHSTYELLLHARVH